MHDVTDNTNSQVSDIYIDEINIEGKQSSEPLILMLYKNPNKVLLPSHCIIHFYGDMPEI